MTLRLLAGGADNLATITITRASARSYPIVAEVTAKYMGENNENLLP